MRRILFIHPYGNVNHNPNLSAIISFLDRQGFAPDILCPEFKEISQNPPSQNSRMIFVRSENWPEKMLEYVKKIPENKYVLVIGIDKGIIPAAEIFKNSKTPYVLLSYEITFADEIGNVAKQNEINSCRNISFAVCQDEVRSQLLSRENHIPADKIFFIPAAGRYTGPAIKSDFLRKKLNLSENTKIALFTGSLSSWTMTDELVDSVANWPDPWVLVLHPRYGNRGTAKYLNKAGISKKIYISSSPWNNIEEMQAIITSADAGIAFYKPDPDNPLLGKNILFIGLASSKIALYLSYGLPVITNEIGQMSELMKNYGLGLVIKDIKAFDPSKINSFNQDILRKKCIAFFRKTLDFALYENTLNLYIQSAIVKKYIKIRSQILDLPRVSESDVNQTVALYKDYQDLYRNYKTGMNSGKKRILQGLSEQINRIKYLVQK